VRFSPFLKEKSDTSRMLKNIVRVFGFQCVWFASILGAADGLFWLGPMAVLAWLCVSLMMSGAIQRELLLAIIAAGVGLCTDSALLAAGIFVPSGLGEHLISPPWMVGLWVNLATILNTSLSWLKGRPVLATTIGAIGGPLAYYSGAQLGAAVIAEPLLQNLAVIGIEWALALPLLVRLSEWSIANRLLFHS
jgi:hypothetical protein